MLDIRQQQTERRAYARAQRNNSLENVQVLCNGVGMQRAGAAKRHQNKLAGIEAALHRDQTHGLDHVRVSDLNHAECGFSGVQT